VPYPSLSERFREADTSYLSPSRIAAMFGWTPEEIALRARVPLAALARPQTSSLQRYLGNLVRVLAVASEMTGDVDRAALLIRQEPLRAFGGKTIAGLISEDRTDDAVTYLQSLASGSAG
jgi:hypothetical protein